MSDTVSSFSKWVGGILATIITGVVLWWLTGPNSPFASHNNNVSNDTEQHDKMPGDTGTAVPAKTVDATGEAAKPNEEKIPAVVITRYDFKNPINIGESSLGDFEVSNKGNAAATGCQVMWELPGLNGTKMSDKFDLQPGEAKSFQLTSELMHQDGTITTSARVSCSNTSDVVETKQLVVNKMMNRNNFGAP